MGRTAKGNDDLLIIGGAGLLAVLLFSGVLTKSSGSSESGSVEIPWSGSGDTSPTIYQIPGDAGVTFPTSNPTSNNLDLAGLLSLLGAGTPSAGDAAAATIPTTKKAAATKVYDAGQVTETGEVIKTPFVSKTEESFPWWERALNAAPSLLGGVSLLANPATAALGAASLMLNVADFAGVASTKKEAATATAATQGGNGTRFGADSTWNPASTNKSAGSEIAATKKEAVSTTGKSYVDYNQPLYDRSTGAFIGYVGQDAVNLAAKGESYGIFDVSGPHFTDTPAGGTYPKGSVFAGQGAFESAPLYGSDYNSMIALWTKKGWIDSTSVSANKAAATKVYDAGQVTETGEVIKTPFVSKTGTTKKSSVTKTPFVSKTGTTKKSSVTKTPFVSKTGTTKKSSVTTTATRTTTVKKSSLVSIVRSLGSIVRIGGSSGFGGGGSGGR